jgi:hypothetical protein
MAKEAKPSGEARNESIELGCIVHLSHGGHVGRQSNHHHVLRETLQVLPAKCAPEVVLWLHFIVLSGPLRIPVHIAPFAWLSFPRAYDSYPPLIFSMHHNQKKLAYGFFQRNPAVFLAGMRWIRRNQQELIAKNGRSLLKSTPCFFLLRRALTGSQTTCWGGI